jgi:peroxiredoxin
MKVEVCMVQPGTKAPEFSMACTPDQKITLSDFKGRNLILVFYPADWSPVCGDQLALYNELKEEFDKYDASIVGVSVDGIWCHTAFHKDRQYSFPLLSDFEPKGAIAKRYGVYREADGFCERAIVVIDKEGIVRWSYVSPIGINPGASGIIKALAPLKETACEL